MSILSGSPWLQPDAMQNGVASKLFGGNSNPGIPEPDASSEFALATQQQWANYVDTFIPIENNLINYATSPTTVSDAMSSAQTGVQNAFTAAQGSQSRQLAGLGTSLTAPQQEESTRSSALTESLADVQSQNTARDLTMQNQQQILGNPAPQASTGAGIGGGS